MAAQALLGRFQFPEPLAPFFDQQAKADGSGFEPLPYTRFKVAYGGRGSAKSWTAAQAILIRMRRKKLRVVGAREHLKSVAESVHDVFSQQINRLGFNDFFTINKTSIRSANGGLITYDGLWRNVDSIKSKEGIDLVWVEEAHNVSKTSFEKLEATIRRPLSEIWITYNPELDDDYIHKRFVRRGDPQAILMKVNWRDNPWFGEPMLSTMIAHRERDYDGYLHTWEGHTIQFLEGAVYANELRSAQQAGRITKVPYERGIPVHLILDLGWGDNVAMWMVQKVGFEYHVINFWQGRKTDVPGIIKVVADLGYMEGTYFLPHDGNSGYLASGGVSVADLFRGAGKQVTVIQRSASDTGIKVARSLFPRVYFDEVNCADGLQCLRRYRYEVDEDTGQFSRTPLHDQNSHAADAFRYFALSTTVPDEAPVVNLTPPRLNLAEGRGHGWMRR